LASWHLNYPAFSILYGYLFKSSRYYHQKHATHAWGMGQNVLLVGLENPSGVPEKPAGQWEKKQEKTLRAVYHCVLE
jgi:hypothetical protein